MSQAKHQLAFDLSLLVAIIALAVAIQPTDVEPRQPASAEARVCPYNPEIAPTEEMDI